MKFNITVNISSGLVAYLFFMWIAGLQGTSNTQQGVGPVDVILVSPIFVM